MEKTGEMGNRYERKSEENRTTERTTVERGEGKRVTLRYLNRMENQDPKEHRCAWQLKAEFKVCRI